MGTLPVEYDYFYAALFYFAEKRGRGFQVWLHASTGIAEPTISNIITKERMPNLEQQIKIANALEYFYIDFLSYGKKIMQDSDSPPSLPRPTPTPPADEYTSLIGQAGKVLQSGTIFADVLKQNIKAFYVAVNNEKKGVFVKESG